MTREDCIKKLEEVRNKYTQLNSGIVFYRSPVTNDVECRVAYFENISEAALWLDEKEKFYRLFYLIKMFLVSLTLSAITVFFIL